MPEVASPWAGRYAVARAEFAKIKAALKMLHKSQINQENAGSTET
ncbi:hypothetical protein [Trebonia sp.]